MCVRVQEAQQAKERELEDERRQLEVARTRTADERKQLDAEKRVVEESRKVC